MNEYLTFGLGGDHKDDTEQVRGQARPGRIGNGQDGPVYVIVDLVSFGMGGNMNVIFTSFQGNPQLVEGGGYLSQIFPAHIFNGEFTLGIIPTVMPTLLPFFLKIFSKKFPKVILKIEELNTQSFIEQISDGRLDAAIGSTPGEAPPQIIEIDAVGAIAVLLENLS